MKTIKELANMGERVYVHLNDEETAMRFRSPLVGSLCDPSRRYTELCQH